MKRKLLLLLLSLASLALVSCGGGNDVASSGASAVSAAAPASNASPASAPSTPATTPTEPKINGQIDERTGVAPVVAQATIWTPYSNGGCLQSVSMYYGGNGPKISEAQVIACGNAMSNANANAMSSANAQQQCKALGGWFLYNYYCTIPVAAP